MGRFDFTLLAGHGRVTGVVVVPTGTMTRGEIAQEAIGRSAPWSANAWRRTGATDAPDVQAPRPVDGGPA